MESNYCNKCGRNCDCALPDDFYLEDEEDDDYQPEECDMCGRFDCVCDSIMNCTCGAWTKTGAHIADCICGGGL